MWLDICCDVHEAEHALGRQRATDRFEPGSASLVLDNRTGWADPTPPAGDPALLSLRTGRSIRLGIEHATLGRIWKWRGFVDAVEPRYDPVLHDVVDVSAVCALAEVGRVPLAALAAPVGDGELAGTRINRILNAARWLANKRAIEQNRRTWLTPRPTAPRPPICLTQVADSVGGAVYGDTLGRVRVPRPATGRSTNRPPRTTARSANIAASDVARRRQLSDRRADIVTQTILGRETDVEPVVRDDWSASPSRCRTFEVTDLVCRDAIQLTRLSQRLFRPRWTTSTRIETSHLDAATSDAALDLMTAVDVFKPSRYRCRM